MNLPTALLYTEEHAWVRVVAEGKVRIGITHFAQAELGDIVFVELPEVGATVTVNQPFGSVESVKTVSELYAPVSGKVVEVNASLPSSPENVNDAPYEEGWMIVIEMHDADQLKNLLSAQAYEKRVIASS
jgi:glycine cleavage system H protein